jgi:hypothetical protein
MSKVFVETWNYKTYYIIVYDIRFAIAKEAKNLATMLFFIRVVNHDAIAGATFPLDSDNLIMRGYHCPNETSLLHQLILISALQD